MLDWININYVDEYRDSLCFDKEYRNNLIIQDNLDIRIRIKNFIYFNEWIKHTLI